MAGFRGLQSPIRKDGLARKHGVYKQSGLKGVQSHWPSSKRPLFCGVKGCVVDAARRFEGVLTMTSITSALARERLEWSFCSAHVGWLGWLVQLLCSEEKMAFNVAAGHTRFE